MKYNNKIEYLKRKIKRTYKWYTNERTDVNATILDIAKLFKIKLDEKYLSSYKIKSINYNDKINIEIEDTNNNILYKAFYSDNLVNSLTNRNSFIYVTILEDNKKINRAFYINDDEPFLEDITYSKNNENIVLRKDINKDIFKEVIIELENPITIFSKSIKRTNNYILEQIDSCDKYGIHMHKNFDRYCYKLKDNNIIYGINELNKSEEHIKIQGFCIKEKKDNVIYDYVPYNMKINKYKELFDDNCLSVIIFNGYEEEIGNSLEIYKYPNKCNIKYIRFNNNYNNDCFEINTDNGYIDSKLINEIIILLKEKINNRFIELTIEELNKFKEQLEINNELKNEYSLNNFIDKNIFEIDNIINNSKYLNEYKEDAIKKVLKP